MARIVLIPLLVVFGSAVLLPGCRTAAATQPPASATSAPAATRTPLPPSSTPSPDLEGTAGAAWEATLQAGQTQNAAHLATSRVEQTAAAIARATGLALTPAKTPLPPTPTGTATPSPTPSPEPGSFAVLDPGKITWAETRPIVGNSAGPGDDFRGQQLIFHNSFVYLFGGRDASEPQQPFVRYSEIGPNGELGQWLGTTLLPQKSLDQVVVKVGDYVYLLTGAPGGGEVYYAPFQPDGSIGNWQITAPLPPSREGFAAAGYGNFIYTTGGETDGNVNAVQYTSVRTDGSLDSWGFTTPLPARIRAHTMIAYGGHLYVFGGKNDANQPVNGVYYSAIQPDGALGPWRSTSSMPETVAGFSTFESNGIVYLLGGDLSGSYYARILEDFTLDAWRGASPFPGGKLHAMRTGANNGVAYTVGGYDLVTYKAVVYFGVIGSGIATFTPEPSGPTPTGLPATQTPSGAALVAARCAGHGSLFGVHPSSALVFGQIGRPQRPPVPESGRLALFGSLRPWFGGFFRLHWSR